MDTPAALTLNLLEHITHMKSLPRTGWLFAGVAQPESIADHTCAVALLALFMTGFVNAGPSSQGLDRPLDPGKVVRLALCHDLAESIVTDLPKRTTQLFGAAAKHAVEQQAMADLLADIPAADQHLALWREYDQGHSAEARLVRDADKLEMVHQALAYQRRGHRNLDDFWQGHTWHYPLSQALYSALQQRRDQV